MPPLRARAALCGLALLVLVPTPGHAGHNAGGHAHLSWDRAGADSVLTAVPVAPFALYLHLRDAPDIRALAVRIAWTSGTAAPPCFFLQSSPEPELSVPPELLFGWAVQESPGAGFQGDSAYHWTIRFPAGSEARDCVRYLVSAAGWWEA